MLSGTAIAEASGGEQRDHELRAVAEQERDPVARPDAPPGHAGGQPPGPRCEIAVGQAGIAIDQSECVRVAQSG
jgi:hypothetical protein